MTNTTAKLMLSMITTGFAMLICMLVVFVLTSSYFFRYSYVETYLIASLVTGGFNLIAWIWIWQRPGLWSRHRQRKMIFATLGAYAAGGLVTLLLEFLPVAYVDEYMLAYAGTMFATLSTLTAFVIIIKETPLELSARQLGIGVTKLVCPSCNYDMTGLHTTDCPECGTKFSVDEFVLKLRAQQTAPTIDDSENQPN